MNVTENLSGLGSIATAVGVAVAAYQLLVARQQDRTTFEDTLNAQYRLAIEKLPPEALFGEAVKESEMVALLPHFYRYFDLCNEQAFLHERGRISKATWKNWEDGIRTNMNRPAFAVAWAEVAARAKGDFEHLRKLCPPQVRSSTFANQRAAFTRRKFGSVVSCSCGVRVGWAPDHLARPRQTP